MITVYTAARPLCVIVILFSFAISENSLFSGVPVPATVTVVNQGASRIDECTAFFSDASGGTLKAFVTRAVNDFLLLQP